jgi:uncharacterized protein
MTRLIVYFSGSLRDLLPPYRRREPDILVEVNEHPSIKHVIEDLGVPHTEVVSIATATHRVDFSYHVQEGDVIAVEPITRRDEADLRFILDNHLGKLAIYLRILGFDTLYRNDYQDEELAATARQQGRILLTRDRHLLMRNEVTRGCCVTSLDPQQQLVTLLLRYKLQEKARPFQRCLRCNSPLQPVAKETILPRLEPLTRLYYDDFHLCPACDQVYWKGSHYESMDRLIESLGIPHP